MTHTQWVVYVAAAVGVMLLGSAAVVEILLRAWSRAAVTAMTTGLAVYAVLSVGLHR